MLRDEIRNDWNLEMEDGGLTQCVRRFGVGVGNGGEGEVSRNIETEREMIKLI